MQHAIIIAGGPGSRLWPASREGRPKHLLRIHDGHSSLELARERLRGVVPAERTWIVSAAKQMDQIAAALPDLPRGNLITEPSPRDTANAIGLATQLISRSDPDATLLFCPADHIIRPIARFESAVRNAFDTAQAHPAALITFGINPTHPHTGYGYLRRGEPQRPGVYRVREFREKPTAQVAEQYLASGEYYWNAGIFAWRASALLAELSRQLPENAATLAKIADRGVGFAQNAEAAALWAGLKKISIDYGVMEGAREVHLVELNCDWLDIGSWTSLAATVSPDASGNALIAPRALPVDSQNSIIVSEDDHLILAFGVDDLVIVHTPDATLVCRKDQVERIRALADVRRKYFGETYE